MDPERYGGREWTAMPGTKVEAAALLLPRAASVVPAHRGPWTCRTSCLNTKVLAHSKVDLARLLRLLRLLLVLGDFKCFNGSRYGTHELAYRKRIAHRL